MKIRNIFFKFFLAIVFLVFAGGCVFYFFQDWFIFLSKKLPQDYTFTFQQSFSEYFLEAEDSTVINILVFEPTRPSGKLLLYFHGNADNLQRWGAYAEDFTTLGYTVVMMDYRGYGKSSGIPNEDALYADALRVWKWAANKFRPSHVVFYGRSLGAAVASKLASVIAPDLLMLETPFQELKGAYYPWTTLYTYILPLRYTFPTYKHIQNVQSKIVIVHGNSDWVVPLRSAEKLKPYLKSNDRFVVIVGGAHNNLRTYQEYHQLLREVL